jgi:hypothetical protein
VGLAACQPFAGGVNRGDRAPGSGDEGISLGRLARREIAVDPSGAFALYHHQGLILADLRAQKATALGELPAPAVVAFWPAGGGFFGLTAPEPEQRLYAYDTERRALRWEQPVMRSDLALKPLAGGQRLLTWGTAGNARLVSASGGQTEGLVPVTGTLVDVDELPSGELLLTEAPPRGRSDEGRRPKTTLRIVTPGGEERCRVDVENCADEVLVAPGGRRAFLAPTFCGADPVSVIDLVACKLEATLPGFGPVALAQQGSTVVAFADRQSGEGLPEEIRRSEVRYHLLLIDARSLALEALPLGDWLPRYAAPPSGRLLIVDTARRPPVQPRIVDLERRSVEVIYGPALPLDTFVVTPDERHVFAMASGLYLLRVERQQLDSLPLAFVPEAINRTPDGQRILLLEGDRLHLLQPDPLRFVGLISPR